MCSMIITLETAEQNFFESISCKMVEFVKLDVYMSQSQFLFLTREAHAQHELS